MDSEDKEALLPLVVNLDNEPAPLTPISRILSSIRTPTYITNDSPQNSMSPASLCYQYKEANEQTGRELDVTKHHNEQLKKSLEDEQLLREETEKEVENLSAQLKIRDRKLENMAQLKNELATLRNENFEISSVIPDRDRLRTQNLNLIERCKDFNSIKSENASLRRELDHEIEKRGVSDQKVKYLVESKKESQNLEEEIIYLQEQNDRYKQQQESQIAELENLKSEKEDLEQEVKFLREDGFANDRSSVEDFELPVYKGENLSVELELQELKSRMKEMEQSWLEPVAADNLNQQVAGLQKRVVELSGNYEEVANELKTHKELMVVRQGDKEKSKKENEDKLFQEYSELERGLNQQIKSLLEEKNQLIQQLEDSCGKNSQLQLEKKHNEDGKKELHSDWLKKEEQWLTIEDKLKMESEKLENSIKNLKNRLDQSENQVESLKENLKKTEEENQSFLASISLIEKQTEDLIKEKNVASFEINSLEEKLKELKQEKIESENEYCALCGKYNDLMQELKESLVAEKKNDFEEDLISAQQDIKSLMNENETLKSNVDETQIKLTEFNLKNDLLSREIENHLKALQTKNESIKILELLIQQLQDKDRENKSVELRKDLKEVTEKLHLLAENVTEMESERSIVVKERDDLQTHADNLTLQLDNAHLIIEQKLSQSNKIMELENKNQELSEIIEEIKKDLGREKEMKKKVEEKLDQHRGIVEDLTETLKTSDEQMKRLNHEKDDLKSKYLDCIERLDVLKKQVAELQKKSKTEAANALTQKKEIRDLQIRISETNFAKYEAQNLAETLTNKVATLQKEVDQSGCESDRVWAIVKHREAEIENLKRTHDEKVSRLEESLKQRENEMKSLQGFKASQQSIAFIDESPDNSRFLESSYLSPSKLIRSQSEDKLLTPTNQNQHFGQYRFVSQDCLNDSIECEKNAKKMNFPLKINLESTPSKRDQSRSCMSIESSLISKAVEGYSSYSTGDLNSTTQFPANITLDTSMARNRGHDTSVAQRRATMAAAHIPWHGEKNKIDAMAPTQEEAEQPYYESRISTFYPRMEPSNFNPPMVEPSTSKLHVANTLPISNPKIVEPFDPNPQMVMSSPLVDPLVRIAELQRRNMKYKAHLKSSYPIETQSLSFDHDILSKGKTPSKCDEAVRTGDPRLTLERFGNSSKNLNSTLRSPHGLKRKGNKESSLVGSKSRRETMSTYNLRAPHNFFSTNSASLNDIAKENEEPRGNPRRESTMFEIPNTPPAGKEVRKSKRNKQPVDGAAPGKDLKTSHKLIGEKRTPSMLDRFRKPLRKKNVKK